MPIPLNRIIAFAGPYISLVAGAIASMLVAKANVLGIDGLDEPNLATQLSGALTFALVATLSWLGQSQWLRGHRVQMLGDAEVTSAALAAPPAAPATPPDPDAGPTDLDADLVAAMLAEDPLLAGFVDEPPDGLGELAPDAQPSTAFDDSDVAPIATTPLPETIVDEALPEETEATPPEPADVPDATPDELRVVMPSESDPEGEPDEEDQ